MRTFKRVLVNYQQIADFHFVAKRDAIGGGPARAGAGCRVGRHVGRSAARQVVSRRTGAGVQGGGATPTRVQHLRPDRDHAEQLSRFLIRNAPDKIQRGSGLGYAILSNLNT